MARVSRQRPTGRRFCPAEICGLPLDLIQRLGGRRRLSGQIKAQVGAAARPNSRPRLRLGLGAWRSAVRVNGPRAESGLGPNEQY